MTVRIPGKIIKVPLSVQALERLCNEESRRDATILVPPGIFTLRRPLIPSSNTRLIGFGLLTIIRLAGNANCHIVSTKGCTGITNLSFRHLTFVGNARHQRKPDGLSGLTWSCCFYMWKVRRARFKGIFFFNIAQTGIQLFESNWVDIRNCFGFRFGWSGIATTRANNIYVKNVYFQRTGYAETHSGIHFDGGSGIWVEKANLAGSSGNGLMLDSQNGPLRTAFLSVKATRCFRGVSLSGARENDLHHVQLKVDATRCDVGVLVSHSSDVTVDASSVRTDQPIVIQGETTKNISILNLKFDHNQGRGMTLAPNLDSTQVGLMQV